MSQKKTREQIVSIFQTPDNLDDTEKEKQYDDIIQNGRICDYIMRAACIYGHKQFIIKCINNKIPLHQSLLYLYIIWGDVDMCKLCITNGCNVDKGCMSIACKIMNTDVIDYFLKQGLTPDNNDITQIFHYDQQGNNYCTIPLNYSKTDKSYINHLLTNIIVYGYKYDATSPKEKDFYNKAHIPNYGKYGIYRFYNDKVIPFLKYLSKKKINLPKKIYKYFQIKNDWTRQLKDIIKDETEYMEMLESYSTYYFGKKYEMNTFIILCKNKQLNEKCIDNLIKNCMFYVLGEVLIKNKKYYSSEIIKYTLDRAVKNWNFSFISQIIVNFINSIDIDSAKTIIDKCTSENQYMGNTLITLLNKFNSQLDKTYFTKIINYAIKNTRNDDIVNCLNHSFDKLDIDPILDYALANNNVIIIEVLTKNNVKLDQKCQDKIINANPIIKYLVENQIFKFELVQ
jgi:hypothetical protein